MSEAMSDCLEKTWETITAALKLEPNFRDEWWIKILQNYSEERRTYHNLSFLENKFNMLPQFKDEIKNLTAFSYGIFFQYFEYEPKEMVCLEKNVKHFWTFIVQAQMGESADAYIYSDVAKLILEDSADVHREADSYGTEDYHYFLDLDMVDMGASDEEYKSYTEKLREEHAFLSDHAYFSLRIKTLKTFLQIPNIFATRYFRDRYENRARRNIEREIERLQEYYVE